LNRSASDVHLSPSFCGYLVATVVKFHQKDKEEGDRRIFKMGLGSEDQPLWDLLQAKRDGFGRKRQFIVVFDEGHNLSDQQSELLLDLAPDAKIIASATMRVPEKRAKLVDRLRDEKKWTQRNLITPVSSTRKATKSHNLVLWGLVKN